MAPRESRTHRVAHFKQDNGELTQDVVPKEVLEPGRQSPHTETGRPPHDDPDKRVVGGEPVGEVPERAHPEDPLPGTLPRPHEAEQDQGEPDQRDQGHEVATDGDSSR